MSISDAGMKRKAVLVTGAASGIGLATVELFLREGARVALNHLPGDSRGADEVRRLAGEGLDVIAISGDVSDPVSCENMVLEAIAILGGLDVLVNNAGTPGSKAPVPFSNLADLTDDIWEKIISTNLVGAYRCTKFAAAALQLSGGSVVNTASIGGFDVPSSSIAYGASKAGLINMTKNLARALAPRVRVNAVAPGYVESPWTSDWTAERKNTFIEKALLKKSIKPYDVAKAIYFFSDETSVITGQTLVIDAGLSLA